MRDLFDDNPIWTEREFSHPERTIRLGSLFSGIGAIEHALKRLNLKTEILFASDIDANCKKSYFANYDITEDKWCPDVHKLNAKPYRFKCDLLVGGAPCQAFSLVGKRRGFEDTRGTLFREFARVVKECKPKVFIFENVRGMLNHNKGITWDVIKNTFEHDLKYNIRFQVLNSRNYGIPQNRERLFCIGFRKKTDFIFPEPIPLEYKMYDFLEDYIDSKYFLSDKVKKYVLSPGTKNFKTSTKTDLDVARPLLQSMHKMHRAGVDNYVTNKGRIRKLTPRECLRLMGFKDWFKIAVADTAMYQEAGNSIVVDVLIAILKQMDITKYGIDKD